MVSPTETIVNTRNNYRTVRRIHPTHIRNVNRNITRVENYYPVTESEEYENYVEEYDCGSDIRNSCCCNHRRNRCDCC
ncbi:CotD family spore coat protein [Rossellomorea yichunensis]|uniref:CotD family spore coat protein n=1 Tax=Rossellomorea yichunensis TaxID=3077331 RepID=UPI0028E05363|nr:CotD family spore coat protein [Rossellomorea sp. YC4-1]MDT9027816.1 CotD family spore coat protein [Rossellomorea sp. YC4-1]